MSETVSLAGFLDRLNMECTRIISLFDSASPELSNTALYSTTRSLINLINQDEYNNNKVSNDEILDIKIHCNLIEEYARELINSKKTGPISSAIKNFLEFIKENSYLIEKITPGYIDDHSERQKKELDIVLGRARELIRQMDRGLNEVEIIKARTSDIINRSDSDIKGMISRADEAEAKIDKRVEVIDTILSDTIRKAEDTEEQLNEILGYVAGRAIAGDFEKNAKDEKKIANWLRGGSIICMALIVAIATYTFIETAQSGFDFERQISKFLLILIIMIPAAYLARESEKHRQQQNSHMQKSLDLKTITPFLASLPDEQQHRIKSEIAGKLFAAGNIVKEGKDIYPVNIQELLMELLKKFEPTKSTEK